MSVAGGPLRQGRSRRRRRRRSRRPLILALALLLAFGLGLGLGEALHDNPRAGGTQTLVRTLRPLPLVPVAQNTVTITTSKPQRSQKR